LNEKFLSNVTQLGLLTFPQFSMPFAQTTPLSFRFPNASPFHPSGHKLNSKDFFLIPRNNSNLSTSIINFRTIFPACLTIRPATCTIFHRKVAMVCFIHDSGQESRLNPINRLYAITPILKKTALAWVCPQGIRSIPKPIFNSLLKFSARRRPPPLKFSLTVCVCGEPP